MMPVFQNGSQTMRTPIAAVSGPSLRCVGVAQQTRKLRDMPRRLEYGLDALSQMLDNRISAFVVAPYQEVRTYIPSPMNTSGTIQ